MTSAGLSSATNDLGGKPSALGGTRTINCWACAGGDIDLEDRPFKPLLERAGVPRIRFHDLRHTCATLLLGQGVHPKVVSEMLGHTDVGVTLDLYSHGA